jgi:D-sedoheptulose 7-phosphate isomerase
MTHTARFLADTIKVLESVDQDALEAMAARLVDLRERGGRLFIVGVGGGAGHSSHAVADFRKIAGIEAYSASDNVSELTARANDEGWETVYAGWLAGSRISSSDALLVFSVGGGDNARGISVNIVRAIDYSREAGAAVLGVVGRDGGYTAQVADVCVVVPTVDPDMITAQTEAFQALAWHLLVSHPDVQTASMKWESTI